MASFFFFFYILFWMGVFLHFYAGHSIKEIAIELAKKLLGRKKSDVG